MVSLKNQLDESKKTEELMNHKLKNNIEDYEELEAKLDVLRKELTMTTARIKDSVKFEKSTKMLDKILSRQRSPFDKTRLGYYNSLKETSSSEVKAKLSVKGDEGRSRKCNEELKKYNISNWNRRFEFRKVEMPRRPLSTRYENIFLGDYYACRNFGHKAIHCKSYARNDYMRNIFNYGYPKENHANNRYGNAQGIVNRNYNPFNPLMDQKIVCYKCNNLGHKAHNCKDMVEDAPIIKKEKPTTICEKKENSSKEDYRLALIVENKEDEWYIDSEFSTHMTGDQNKIISLKKGKSGSVAFGNDSYVKILGKGVVNLGNEKVKAANVLLVEYLKNNLLQCQKNV